MGTAKGGRKTDQQIHKAIGLPGSPTAPKYSTNGGAFAIACSALARERNVVVGTTPHFADGADPGRDAPASWEARAYVLGQPETYVVRQGVTKPAAGCAAAVALLEELGDAMREVLPTRLHVGENPERVWADPKSVTAGGAPNRYVIQDELALASGTPAVMLEVVFQSQDPREGLNGITNEALLAIVLDRLERFQLGPFRCTENTFAAGKVEKALEWLRRRAKKRHDRGVLGKAEK